MFDKFFEGYCCVDLLRATESKLLTEVSSGIYLKEPGDQSVCRSLSVQLNFCPFCGAKIITEHNEIQGYWTWRTEKITHDDK